MKLFLKNSYNITNQINNTMTDKDKDKSTKQPAFWQDH